MPRRCPRSFPPPKVDRISTLPNSVLSHILSFLSTKDAAATSVLSKRWKPLWLSLLTLDFDEQTFPNFSRFRHIVSSVFLLRDPKLPIQALRLKCVTGIYSGFNLRDIDIFVHSASQRGIENLTLEHAFKFRVDYRLPSSVFSCRNLVVLKFNNLIVDELSYTVDFPSLKILHMEGVNFTHSKYFVKFLFGCSVLEDLETKGIKVASWFSKQEFKRSLRRLVTASIYDLHDPQFPVGFLSEAKFLHLQLKYINYLYVEDLPTFHRLTEIQLLFRSNCQVRWKSKWLLQVLQQCPKLQHLTIYKETEDSASLEQVLRMPRSMDCVKRAWHSERHQPIRGTLIQEIIRVVNEIHGSSTKKNKEYQEKLPVVVLRAEEIMYSKANSEAEYMDLATLLERTNDAIDTIIRRDEHTETGDYLRPCIEAALSLGCSLTKASSRSQRNNSSRCYLKEEVPNVSLNTSTIKLQQVSENVPSSVYYGRTSESAAIIGGGAQRSQSFITSTDDSEKNTSTDKCDLSLRLGPFK